MYYLLSIFALTVGMAYAAVPLYRLFCQASGFAGTVKTDIDVEKIASKSLNTQSHTFCAKKWKQVITIICFNFLMG